MGILIDISGWVRAVNTDAKNLQNNSALSLPVEAVTPRSDHFIVTGIDLLFVLDFIKDQKRLGFLELINE